MIISTIPLVLLSYAVVVSGLCSWRKGDSIPIGTRCVIPGGAFHFQGDGNVVITNSNGKTVWHAGTNGRGHRINFQNDGNVVVVDAKGKFVWHTGTNGKGANFLQFQADRNLVVSKQGVPGAIWHSGSNMGVGEQLHHTMAASRKLEAALTAAQSQLATARNDLATEQQGSGDLRKVSADLRQELEASAKALKNVQEQLTDARNQNTWFLQQLSDCWSQC